MWTSRGARANIGAVAPNEHQEGVARDKLAGMSHQKFKQCECFARELHERAIEQCRFTLEVHRQVKVLIALQLDGC